MGGDNFGRTESIRIFSAGLSSANEYFLMTKRLVTFDPTTAYEQGFNVGLNMQALVSILLCSVFRLLMYLIRNFNFSIRSSSTLALETFSIVSLWWAHSKIGTSWPSMVSEMKLKVWVVLLLEAVSYLSFVKPWE